MSPKATDGALQRCRKVIIDVLCWLFIAGVFAVLFVLLRESDFVGECLFGLY